MSKSKENKQGIVTLDIPYGSYDIREYIDNRKPDIVCNVNTGNAEPNKEVKPK